MLPERMAACGSGRGVDWKGPGLVGMDCCRVGRSGIERLTRVGQLPGKQQRPIRAEDDLLAGLVLQREDFQLQGESSPSPASADARRSCPQ